MLSKESAFHRSDQNPLDDVPRAHVLGPRDRRDEGDCLQEKDPEFFLEVAAPQNFCCAFREIRCQFIILARKDEPTSRQESSGKGDSWKLETFQMEPCG